MIEVGQKYEIASEIKSIYNRSDVLRIIRISDKTVQFSLDDGKGHGSMPIQHFHYLLRRNELTLLPNKAYLLKEQEVKKDIG